MLGALPCNVSLTTSSPKSYNNWEHSCKGQIYKILPSKNPEYMPTTTKSSA